jgi:hypothetical protein
MAVEFATVFSFEPCFKFQTSTENHMKPDFENEFARAGTGSPSATSHSDSERLSAGRKVPRFAAKGIDANQTQAPDVLRMALNNAKYQGDLFDASLRAVSQRPPRANNPAPDLKLAEFSVQLPEATKVQLAADFTDWEKSPIDLIRFEDGVWSTLVPLPPGNYAYRFLVDAEWYDDPRDLWRNASNGVIKIE